MSKAFKEWWDSADNFASKMPQTTRAQMEFFMREAFNAGAATYAKRHRMRRKRRRRHSRSMTTARNFPCLSA
jgi:hypothetical protein